MRLLLTTLVFLAHHASAQLIFNEIVEVGKAGPATVSRIIGRDANGVEKSREVKIEFIQKDVSPIRGDVALLSDAELAELVPALEAIVDGNYEKAGNTSREIVFFHSNKVIRASAPVGFFKEWLCNTRWTKTGDTIYLKKRELQDLVAILKLVK